jgi:hypothetical protein
VVETTLQTSEESVVIITLCGSARFESQFHSWNERLTLAGHTVFGLTSYPSVHGGKKDWYTEEQKKLLGAAHLRKIDASDVVLVLNVDGYVGDSTEREIRHAVANNKRVYVLTTSGVYGSDALDRLRTDGLDPSKIGVPICHHLGCDDPAKCDQPGRYKCGPCALCYE